MQGAPNCPVLFSLYCFELDLRWTNTAKTQYRKFETNIPRK
jgi:hypothetical protein